MKGVGVAHTSEYSINYSIVLQKNIEISMSYVYPLYVLLSFDLQ